MKHFAIIMVLLALAACSTTPKPSEVKTVDGKKSDRLSARTLLPGECGLFVWSAGVEKRFILFSKANVDDFQAVWFNGHNEEALTTQNTSGTATNGHYPTQKFITPDGNALHLNLKSPKTIETGTAYPGGTLKKVMAQGGYDRVMPVLGLSMCQ